MNKESLRSDLEGFTGSEIVYKHFLSRLVFTEGIKYLADTAGAYWLIDVVASYQGKLFFAPFQLWRLRVRNKYAVISCREDSGLRHIARQYVPYTDFPLRKFEFYVCDNTMLLESEY